MEGRIAYAWLTSLMAAGPQAQTRRCSHASDLMQHSCGLYSHTPYTHDPKSDQTRKPFPGPMRAGVENYVRRSVGSPRVECLRRLHRFSQKTAIESKSEPARQQAKGRQEEAASANKGVYSARCRGISRWAEATSSLRCGLSVHRDRSALHVIQTTGKDSRHV